MRKNRTGECGATMAEFAIISAVFFMIIFGIIEFGRLFYTHSALTDAARRGARYAVLHDRTANDDECVKKVVVFGETHINPSTCAATGPALINGLTTLNVTVTRSTDYGTNLGIATVEIKDYTFNLSIPLARRTLTMPKYVTTLTTESAGRIPADVVTAP
ncbi:MAG TPA: TadE/TadG family type IV pilus assembly protein [Pyrinomonadaceae bacterium]|nr:TadE/TadG family type IV pilus assembly protein [Pyrinomonadaceae bacterium]